MGEYNSEISELVEALASMETTDELIDTLDKVTKGFGFDGYSYHRYDPNSSVISHVGGWPAQWLEYYEACHFAEVDPVVAKLLTTIKPFSWSEALEGVPLSSKAWTVMREARRYGIKEGGEIPVHECGYGGATFSVFTGDLQRFTRSWHSYKHALHLFCVYLHSRYNEIIGHIPDREINLTGRERECLTLTSKGKTAFEVGIILGISPRTVKDHLQSAADKFDVCSKHHAVVRAIIQRQILP